MLERLGQSDSDERLGRVCVRQAAGLDQELTLTAALLAGAALLRRPWAALLGRPKARLPAPVCAVVSSVPGVMLIARARRRGRSELPAPECARWFQVCR